MNHLKALRNDIRRKGSLRTYLQFKYRFWQIGRDKYVRRTRKALR